jgi:hypothetical protein
MVLFPAVLVVLVVEVLAVQEQQLLVVQALELMEQLIPAEVVAVLEEERRAELQVQAAPA